jgi:hypothetical protein
MFKVGDLVVCVNPYTVLSVKRLEKGKVYKIVMSHDYHAIISCDGINEDIWNGTRFRKVYELNPINKLLYPDYVEKDGYLVPKEIVCLK